MYNRDVPERAVFIPGKSVTPGVPLARYRPLQPVGAVEAYVQMLTQPGDLVVDLFCQGSTIVREAVASGRRALGLSVNPLLLLSARLGLESLDAAAFKAAFTHLADSLKGEIPLQRYLTSLYRSTCPTCGATGVALWFAWDRDGEYPFRKAVRCSQCEEVHEGVPDDRDIETAHQIPPRGLAYYYALDRASPPGHPARERAAELVELYTPRNLSALVDLSMRLEALEVDEGVGRALTAVLVDCFDAGSGLDPYGEERPRPRTLRLPSRYLERNVWLCFEERFAALLAGESPPALPRAPGVETLVGGEGQGYTLTAHPAREIERVVSPDSITLVAADPPRPDAVFWALSALWSGWLWESSTAHALRPLLRRRRFDWDWHWRALQQSLRAAGPLLTTEGRLLLLFCESDEALLESTCLAASAAGYLLEGWGYSPEVGHRLIWRWEGEESAPPTEAEEAKQLERRLVAVAKEATEETLRRRGEPTPRSLLHAGACAALIERGLLARTAAVSEGDSPPLSLASNAVRRALDGSSIAVRGGQGERERAERALRWLARPHRVAEPLSDRVELVVWELLQQQASWLPADLMNAVYTCFTGPLTPALSLVQVCVDSYTIEEGEGLRLRPEDDPRRRAAERRILRGDLAELGRRLAFRVRKRGHWDVRWLEEGTERYVFNISNTAALATHLLAGLPANPQARRCLVLPGGRAELASFKLQYDPRLARAVEVDQWQFIKFRHLRRLVAEEELDRHALKTVLGLDPIAEREGAQIPLF